VYYSQYSAETTASFLPHTHTHTNTSSLKENTACKSCFLSAWMLQGFSKAAIVHLGWWFPLRCVCVCVKPHKCYIANLRGWQF